MVLLTTLPSLMMRKLGVTLTCQRAASAPCSSLWVGKVSPFLAMPCCNLASSPERSATVSRLPPSCQSCSTVGVVKRQTAHQLAQ
ncbi:hypothetical protein D3C80_1745690 [compost metagenome]